jgi:hypothetical protein
LPHFAKAYGWGTLLFQLLTTYGLCVAVPLRSSADISGAKGGDGGNRTLVRKKSNKNYYKLSGYFIFPFNLTYPQDN